MSSKFPNTFSIVLLSELSPVSKLAKSFLSEKVKFTCFKKGEYILKQGEICDKLFIVRKGLVRGFFVINKKEINSWISMDNEFVTSISGYFKNEPAQENIQCLEDTEMEYISFKNMDYAVENFPCISKLNRILLEQYYLSSEKRAFMARIPGAKDCCEYLLNNLNGNLIERCPKKHLALFLNIRPETLSRILSE